MPDNRINPLTVLGLSHSRAERLLRQPAAITALRRYYGLLYHPDVTHDPADNARLAEFNRALDEISRPDRFQYWLSQTVVQEPGQKQALFYRKALEDYQRNRGIAETKSAETMLALTSLLSTNLELLETARKMVRQARASSSINHESQTRYRRLLCDLLGQNCINNQAQWADVANKELLFAPGENSPSDRGTKYRFRATTQFHTYKKIPCVHLSELGCSVNLRGGVPNPHTFGRAKKQTPRALRELRAPQVATYLLGSLPHAPAVAPLHRFITANSAAYYDDILFGLSPAIKVGAYIVGAHMRWAGAKPSIASFYIFGRLDYIYEPLFCLLPG